ncbi:MAG: hypothetical protein M0017_01180 [Desulfobacteraceae bacterium]|nr:hypothetical protein [Desulfobacteraceae bacterium]
MSKKVCFLLCNSMYTLDGIRSTLGLSVENQYAYSVIMYNELPELSDYNKENIDWIRDMEGDVLSTVDANVERHGMTKITMEELGQKLREMNIIIPYGIMRPLETNDNFN